MTWLALLQRGEDSPWLSLIAFALFFGLPLLARILKAVLGRAGIDLEQQGGGSGRTARSARRAEQRRSEDEGEDLWRRLLRGEEAAPPPEPAPPPVVTMRPREEPRPVPHLTQEPRSLEHLERPEGSPLPPLVATEGSVVSPDVSPDVGTLRTRPPQLSTRIAGTTLRVRAQPGGPARGHWRFFHGRRDLRRAFVMSEVLGTPVSERGLGRGHLEWGG